MPRRGSARQSARRPGPGEYRRPAGAGAVRGGARMDREPLFKTQLGRNYELHTCQADTGQACTAAWSCTRRSTHSLRSTPRSSSFTSRPSPSRGSSLKTASSPLPFSTPAPGARASGPSTTPATSTPAPRRWARRVRSSAHTSRLSPAMTGGSRSGRSGT